jgi:hypothetical protein
MLRAVTITARLLIGIGPPKRPFSSFGAMAAPAIPRIALDHSKICDGRGSIHARFALPNVRFAHFEAQVLDCRSAAHGRATAHLGRPWRCRTVYFASAEVLSADAEPARLLAIQISLGVKNCSGQPPHADSCLSTFPINRQRSTTRSTSLTSARGRISSKERTSRNRPISIWSSIRCVPRLRERNRTRK